MSGHQSLRRENGELGAEEARYEYTNLMRWRIERVLGYATAHTLEVKNTTGSYLYDLIFATDNAAGDRIMGDVYRKGLERSAKMRLEAAELRRERKSGEPSLFSAEQLGELTAAEVRQYSHQPPTPPFALSALDGKEPE